MHKQRRRRTNSHTRALSAMRPHIGRDLPRQRRARPTSRVRALDLLMRPRAGHECSSSSLGLHMHKQHRWIVPCELACMRTAAQMAHKLASTRTACHAPSHWP